jgi:hypothetical protein
MVSHDLFGNMKELFMLKNWLILSSDRQTIISKDSVTTLLEPSKDVAFLYENEIKKEDKFNCQSSDLYTPNTTRSPSTSLRNMIRYAFNKI